MIGSKSKNIGGTSLKHGMKLTLKEKKLLSNRGLEPKEFLRIRRDNEKFEFLQKGTGKILTIWRD